MDGRSPDSLGNSADNRANRMWVCRMVDAGTGEYEMKIIGKNKEEYIATVSHTELEKMAGKYYGNMKKLDIGDEINCGEGYDFSYEIKKTCEAMESAMKKFEEAKNTMMKFAIMVGQLPTEKP